MTDATFTEEAMRAANKLFEANGLKFDATTDLTYLDNERWPMVAEGERVVTELLPREHALFKAMADAGIERDALRQKITGAVLAKVGQRMANGEPSKMSVPGSGIMGVFAAVTGIEHGDIPTDLMARQNMLDETMMLMNNLLYYGIKSRINAHGDDSIGVRRGGKVISTKKES